jgi:hypothetical protein
VLQTVGVDSAPRFQRVSELVHGKLASADRAPSARRHACLWSGRGGAGERETGRGTGRGGRSRYAQDSPRYRPRPEARAAPPPSAAPAETTP